MILVVKFKLLTLVLEFPNLMLAFLNTVFKVAQINALQYRRMYIFQALLTIQFTLVLFILLARLLVLFTCRSILCTYESDEIN